VNPLLLRCRPKSFTMCLHALCICVVLSHLVSPAKNETQNQETTTSGPDTTRILEPLRTGNYHPRIREQHFPDISAPDPQIKDRSPRKTASLQRRLVYFAERRSDSSDAQSAPRRFRADSVNDRRASERSQRVGLWRAILRILAGVGWMIGPVLRRGSNRGFSRALSFSSSCYGIVRGSKALPPSVRFPGQEPIGLAWRIGSVDVTADNLRDMNFLA